MTPEIFLSTPSARRATADPARGGLGRAISIHALREEGDRRGHRQRGRRYLISIHALREEGDGVREDVAVFPIQFLSTPSARRATGQHEQL